MHDVETILGLLLAVVALAWAATRLQISYPILLVLGGLGAGVLVGLMLLSARRRPGAPGEAPRAMLPDAEPEGEQGPP